MWPNQPPSCDISLDAGQRVTEGGSKIKRVSKSERMSMRKQEGVEDQKVRALSLLRGCVYSGPAKRCGHSGSSSSAALYVSQAWLGTMSSRGPSENHPILLGVRPQVMSWTRASPCLCGDIVRPILRPLTPVWVNHGGALDLFREDLLTPSEWHLCTGRPLVRGGGIGDSERPASAPLSLLKRRLYPRLMESSCTPENGGRRNRRKGLRAWKRLR